MCVFAEMPHNIPAPSQVYVRCSDPNVICTSDVVQHGEPHDVVFKVRRCVDLCYSWLAKMQVLCTEVA